MKRRLGWKAVLFLPACYRYFVFLGRGKLRVTFGRVSRSCQSLQQTGSCSSRYCNQRIGIPAFSRTRLDALFSGMAVATTRLMGVSSSIYSIAVRGKFSRKALSPERLPYHIDKVTLFGIRIVKHVRKDAQPHDFSIRFRTSSPGPHPCRSQCRMQESSHARASAADSGLHSPKCLIISPSPKISSKIARSSGVHCRRISLFVSSRYLRPTSPFLFLKPRFAANSSGSSALVAFRSGETFTSS